MRCNSAWRRVVAAVQQRRLIASIAYQCRLATRADQGCQNTQELACRNTSTATTTKLSSKTPHQPEQTPVSRQTTDSSRARLVERAALIPLAPSTGRGALPVLPSRRRRRAFASPSRAPRPSNYGISINSKHFVGLRELVKRGRRCPKAAPAAISSYRTAKRWTPTSTAPSTRRKQLDQRGDLM